MPLLPRAEPTHNLTFRVTDAQHGAYRRAALATGARTLSDAITKVLDAWAAEVNVKSKRSKT